MLDFIFARIEKEAVQDLHDIILKIMGPGSLINLFHFPQSSPQIGHARQQSPILADYSEDIKNTGYNVGYLDLLIHLSLYLISNA